MTVGTLALALLLSASPGKPKSVAVLDLHAVGVPENLTQSAALLLPTSVRKAVPGTRVISGADVRAAHRGPRRRRGGGAGRHAGAALGALHPARVRRSAARRRALRQSERDPRRCLAREDTEHRRRGGGAGRARGLRLRRVAAAEDA